MLRKLLNILTRPQKGLTGMETGVIVLAFAIVSSVFAYTVIAAGIFSSERPEVASYAALDQAHSALILESNPVATGASNTVDQGFTMDSHLHYLINSGLCWFIVVMALTGYVVTLKRTGQKWPFWVILSIGWAFLAISNSLSTAGLGQDGSYLVAIWLCSYVLVIASLALLFVKLIQTMKGRQQSQEHDV
jgi:hypothetical protein